MIFKVYGLEEALLTVKLHRGSSVEGTRSGYIAPNSNTTTAVTTKALHRNAQPSCLRVNTNATVANCATTATANTSQVHALPWASCVHNPKPATSAVTGSDSRTATRNAKSCTEPDVLSTMKIAP